MRLTSDHMSFPEWRAKHLHPDAPLSEPMLKAIYAIGRMQGMEWERVDGLCRDTYQRTPDTLTRRQASEFIDTLKGYRNAARE